MTANPSRIPRFTLEGVVGTDVSERLFATEDGLGLSLTRFHRADCDDVVLLVHGLANSRDMFIMPEHTNLVSYLLDHGFTDVWALDFRMSNRFPHTSESAPYTLDDIASWDHPGAMRALREVVGDRRVHVIAHCLGATTFLMSLFGGRIDQVTSVVANSVSLHPRMSRWTRAKLRLAPLLGSVLGQPMIDPRFGEAPWYSRRRQLARVVSLAHRDCKDPACHLLSFMWGSGRPSMFAPGQVEEATHRRISDLCGPGNVHHLRQVRELAVAGGVTTPLGQDEVETPILLLAGPDNRVFADSNLVTHTHLEDAAPGRHELRVLPGYGHLDPFIGKNAHRDVFPQIVEFLKKKAV